MFLALSNRANSKKRPDMITMGRIFNKKILDMLEMQILSIEDVDEGKVRFLFW
jgi:hypothetical protein